jgi:cytochrome c-type biogenesis protein CcmH/NrfG
VEVAPSKYKEPASQLLQGARKALTAGDAGRALSDYKKLIERKQDLETVIGDLEQALERYPNLPTMWQALGDAYMKADQLQEAIKAYQRGMEVA